jgi:hypothetical protein
VFHPKANHPLKRRTPHSFVLLEDRKVFSSVGFSVFSVFTPFAAPVSEAVFLCPAKSVGSRNRGHLPLDLQPFPSVIMQNTTTLAPQAAAGKYLESVGLTRQGTKLSDFTCYLDLHKENDGKLHSGAGVGTAQVDSFILGQKDIRDNVI